MAKDTKKQDEQLENVQEALSTSGRWIEENQNLISWVVLGILAVALCVWLIKSYVIEPKVEQAGNENAVAMTYFLQQNYEVALNGNDDDCMGFAAISDKYHNQPGKLAAYCAGICNYQLGNYEEAIEYLQKYSSKEKTTAAAAKQLLGDAYVQTDQLDKAAKCFEEVGAMDHGILSPMSLMKAAHVYQEQGNEAAARKAYNTIKEKYPQSNEAQTAAIYAE